MASLIPYALFLSSLIQVFSEEFSCVGRIAGYYADVTSDCQQYHVCSGGSRQYTYHCPNTTRFLQKMMICEHAHLVDCSLSEKFFSSNLLLGQRGVPFISQTDNQPSSPQPGAKGVKNLPSLFENKAFIPSKPNTKPILRPLREEPKPFFQKQPKIEIKTQTLHPIFTSTTQKTLTALEKETIKPLTSPQITLSELFKKLYGGGLEENSDKTSSDDIENKGRGMKLDWTLPDVRAMFFIPDREEDNVEPNIKKYSVVIPDSNMVFKTHKQNSAGCPSHCDAQFIISNCTPCVSIK